MTIYYRNHKEYPSVTTVIYFEPDERPSRIGNAAKIGSLIHYHILKNYKKDLRMPYDTIWGIPFDEINWRIEHALDLWKIFQTATSWECVAAEVVIFDDKLGIAGRPDILYRNPIQDCFGVLDIKTGEDYPDKYDMQLAAYAYLTGSDEATLVRLHRDSDIPIVRTLDKDQLEKPWQSFLSKLDIYREYNETD